MTRIVSILPKGEGFSATHFGAVALCVRDFTEHSRYRSETTVIGGTSEDGFAGVNYTFMPPARWFENRTRAYAKHAAAFINKSGAELTEVHNRPALLRLIAAKTRCKIALHLHNDPQEMDDAKTPKERAALLALCDGVYCVSNYIRGRFLEGLDANAAAKVHLVYNGIDIPTALPPKENYITFAGRMTEGKGTLLLAKALRIALPKLSNWRAVLIGSRRHAAAETLTPHEKEIAATLAPLSAQIEMPGFISHSETLAFFARAHIAVVPSLWQEPFGRTAIEAMAYGCALISSGRGGLHEVTQDAALTLTDLTPETLADAILLLATNESARTKLQTAGRIRARDFSIEKCAASLDDARDIIFKQRS